MKNYPSLRKARSREGDIIAEQVSFLTWLWPLGGKSKHLGCMSFRRKGSTRFTDKFVKTGDRQAAHQLLREFDRWRYDQYFCPNLFHEANRRSENVCRTRLGWCDIDAADPSSFVPKPSVLWRTSPGHTQGLWLWDKSYRAHRAAEFSRDLAYCHGGDRGGWAANKLLRIPGSINHKPEHQQPFVRLLKLRTRPIATRPARGCSRIPMSLRLPENRPLDPTRNDPEHVLRKHKSRMGLFARGIARDKRLRFPDRSKAIFMLISGLWKAGAKRTEIASVVWTNVYFLDKYGTDERALSLEVNRICEKLEALT